MLGRTIIHALPTHPLPYPLQRSVTGYARLFIVVVFFNHLLGAPGESFIFIQVKFHPWLPNSWQRRRFTAVSEVLCSPSLSYSMDDFCSARCLPIIHNIWVGRLIYSFISLCITGHSNSTCCNVKGLPALSLRFVFSPAPCFFLLDNVTRSSANSTQSLSPI